MADFLSNLLGRHPLGRLYRSTKKTPDLIVYNDEDEMLTDQQRKLLGMAAQQDRRGYVKTGTKSPASQMAVLRWMQQQDKEAALTQAALGRADAAALAGAEARVDAAGQNFATTGAAFTPKQIEAAEFLGYSLTPEMRGGAVTGGTKFTPAQEKMLEQLPALGGVVNNMRAAGDTPQARYRRALRAAGFGSGTRDVLDALTPSVGEGQYLNDDFSVGTLGNYNASKAGTEFATTDAQKRAEEPFNVNAWLRSEASEGRLVGPDGVAPVPGYVNTMAGIEGANRNAQNISDANFDIVPTVTEDGRPGFTSRANVLGVNAVQQGSPQQGADVQQGRAARGGVMPAEAGTAYLEGKEEERRKYLDNVTRDASFDIALSSAKSKVNDLSTGVFSQMTSWIGGTPAQHLESEMETLRSIIGLGELMNLRDLSASGASGLGQVTEREHKLLQSILGSLETASDDKVVMERLNRIGELRSFRRRILTSNGAEQEKVLMEYNDWLQNKLLEFDSGPQNFVVE